MSKQLFQAYAQTLRKWGRQHIVASARCGANEGRGDSDVAA
jgi:hypothetical protein